MEYSPASKLQVNKNDFSSLMWILKSARQSGRVSIELQAVDEAYIEEPWRAYLVLVEGEVTACYLYRKADGRRFLADSSAMLWLYGLGPRELLWSLESSAPRQRRHSSSHTPMSHLSGPSTTLNGQTSLHPTTYPLSNPRPAPPLQAGATTNPLSVPHLPPSLQSSSHSGTEPLSESGPLVDLQAQTGPRTMTNPSSAPRLSPSPQASPRQIIDQPSDPSFPINYRTGPRTTTDPLSEQHLTRGQQFPPQPPVALQSDSFTPVNQLAPSILTQVLYRIAPIDRGMDAWPRKHKRVFLLIDGIKSVAQMVDLLGLPSATVEQIVADLLSWGVVVSI